MITVKAAKRTTEINDPADRFRLKSDPRRSRVPYMLGAFFAAIAAYLKSSLASNATESPQDARDLHKGMPDDPQTNLGPDDQNLQTSHQDRSSRQQDVTGEGSASQTASVATATARLPINAGVDGNVGLTIASVRATVANSDVFHADGAGVTESQFMFGGSGEVIEAWPRHGGFGSDDGAVSAASDRNRAPRSVRPTYLLDVVSGGAIAIALADLLADVADPDGDVLQVGNVTVSSGTIVPVEGGFVYRAATDAPGPVVVTYQVSDGTAITTLTAQFAVVPNAVIGTALSDTIAGTAASDAIVGQDGNDNISALQGSDIIEGGAGNDTISGGAGNDTILGGAGHDVIYGGAGNDHLKGGTGNDRLLGEAGNDVLMGEAGNDTLSDGAGADTVSGDIGDDVILAAADGASDIYDGGAGADTLDYSSATSTLRIDLVQGESSGVDIGSDVISGFEMVKGGSGDDYFIIGEDEVILVGGGGENVFEFVESSIPTVASITMHQIIDFGVGDMIKTGMFDIFKKPEVAAEALFDALHGDGTTGEATSVIRVRYEAYEDREDTIVEWDSQTAGQMTVVTLNGHQTLIWTEQA